jgi:hypothetical protein
MSDPQDLVSIYKAAHSIEANLVKNLLADEGIQAVVTEENEPLAGLEITPPDVMVRVADEERARAFIEDYEDKQIEKAEAGDDEEDEDFDDEDEDEE